MKLLRYGPVGQERPGVLDPQGRIRDLSALFSDVSGDTLSADNLRRLALIDPESLPLVEGNPRLGACVGKSGKFICIGLNYSDHAAETGAGIPTEPIVFLKAPSAICGPNDALEMPRGSDKLDWEVELGIVIGTVAKYVTEAQALDHVAGYCTVNDVSERGFQMEHQGQWTKGKSCDTFGPIGPWLATADEVPHPDSLRLWCEVNGRRMQDGTTQTMIFKPAFLVSYLSQFMSLQPGDIISTGTPPGVGLGQKPPQYLAPGDVVSVGIDGLGTQQQAVAAAA
ncbi:fumarylacetoacetate hydrolase family protein [Amorphus sp. MBR-141]